MNKNRYRVVFNRARGALMVVQENGRASHGSGSRDASAGVVPAWLSLSPFALRHVALAVLVAAGVVPIWVNAQVVAGGAHAPSVIQTQNGLQQVNINRPGSSGVSMNTYNQFDVPKPGIILNNSPINVQTQLGGIIGGNPNFQAGDAARLIVNQVNSNNPSFIRGKVEIGGAAAQLVIANQAGLVVDGGGFLNTSRATLTTGNPNFGPDGSLTGFNVNQGLISVVGAGLDTANVDQVDLLARAVQVNAKAYAKTLNVVAGSNQVDYNTLNATPIAGNGAAPTIAIDVSQLGGMYANRVFLVSSENGVGVANAGDIAAQAGDLTLQANGRLVLSGQTNAAGNMSLSASGGIQNSGVTYGKQSVTVNTGADLTNSGALTAQQNLTANVGSLNSTGTLGAGINVDSTVGTSGDLNVTSSGQLTATGTNSAAGNATFTGSGVNLSNSATAANGNLALSATAGDVNLAGSTVSAKGAVNAQASGTVVNDRGNLSSGAGMTLGGGSLSNQGGRANSQGPLSVQMAGTVSNQNGMLSSQSTADVRGSAIQNNAGLIQSAGKQTIAGASIDNSAGRLISLNADGLSVTATGALTNAAGANVSGDPGGVIGGKGDVTVQGNTVTNSGSMSADATLHVIGQSVDNGNGALHAGQTTTVDAGNHLSNAGGRVEGQSAVLNGATLDNSQGTVNAATVSLNGTTLLNHGGTVTQTGTGPMTVAITDTLDNSNNGLIQTRSTDLSLTSTTLINDTYQEQHSGLMSGGGLSFSVGNSKLAQQNQSSSVTNNASTVGSVDGNLTVNAGNTLHVQASDLVAGKDVTGTAANIVVDSATDTTHQSQQQQTSKSGLTVGLSGSVGDAINNAISETQAARESAKDSNGRASALHSIAAAGDVAFGGLGAKALLDGAKGPQAPSIGVQVSVGSSHSSMQSSEDQTIQRGSSINAGGNAKLIATGNGTPKDGNITIAGSNVNAANVALIANNQVNLVNTTDTDKTQSSNSSSGSSVGVSIGTNGIGVSASMQRAHGDGNSDAAIQNNTHINASQTATIVSGGDTNVIGANVNANKVVADVGGNLNVASVQDTTVSAAHQSSAGGGFTISQTGGGASFSAQNGHADGNYAGVKEQAGIQAGSGGFDVTVKGNTDLKGAYIGSTADASKNSLTTGTLTTSDIENHSHYSANSAGFSAGASVGVSTKAVGPSSVSGSGGVTPMVFQNDSGDQSATTKSAVSVGAINITKPGEQTQDVANLNRDATNLNGTVSKTPDVQKTLSQQADTMNAAQAAGQTVSQGIGLYADGKRKDAIDAAKAAYERGDLVAMQSYIDQAKSWDEGGASRAGLQATGGALIGGLGGGSVLTAIGGAAGAGTSSLLAGQAEKISKSVGDMTGSSLVGNIAANVAATVGGALVGGSAGAAMASNVELYNAGNDPQKTDDRATIAGLQGLLNQAVAAGAEGLSTIANARNAIGNAISGALDSAADQFGTLMKRDAEGKMSQSPAELVSQGVANGINTVLGSKGGEPPLAGPSAVAVDSLTGQAANAALGATDRTPPSNAILSNSNSDNNSTQGSQSGTVTKTPNPEATGSLSGKPTQIPPLSDEVTTRSLIRENQSAVTLANKGYDVVQNPEVLGPKNPDYTINGQVFDNYAPATGNVRNIATTISNKVSSGQASNIVVNLADSSASPAAIEAQINSYPIPGLGKVIVIDKLGNITIIKPKGN